MTHTKGPWRYDSANCAIMSETEAHDFGNGDVMPVTVFTLYSACGGEDSQADIALTCAAPDMLAALQSALYQLEQCSTSETRENDPDLWAAQVEAIAAIEKATGKAVQS